MPLVASIPSLRGIAAYGSVAEGRAGSDSDIDLVIVCQDRFLHLCRFAVNWRLWRAGLRHSVCAGVVVEESALRPETFKAHYHDRYAVAWFRSLKWIYRADTMSDIRYVRVLNWLAKLFFAVRITQDQQRTYPAPHIRFSDRAFFHFGDSKALKRT